MFWIFWLPFELLLSLHCTGAFVAIWTFAAIGTFVANQTFVAIGTSPVWILGSLLNHTSDRKTCWYLIPDNKQTFKTVETSLRLKSCRVLLNSAPNSWFLFLPSSELFLNLETKRKGLLVFSKSSEIHIMNSVCTCTVVEWGIKTSLWKLYYYCRSQKVVIILPLTTSIIVIHLPQIMHYAPFTHYAGPIWVQNQNFWSKPGLWRRSVVNISKNKNFVQQCGFQKTWNILLLPYTIYN